MTINHANISPVGVTHSSVAAAEFSALSHPVQDSYRFQTTSPAWSALWNVCADMWRSLEQAKAENLLSYKPGEIASNAVRPRAGFDQIFSELALCLLRHQGEQGGEMADFVFLPGYASLPPSISDEFRNLILRQLETPAGQELHKATSPDKEIFSSISACWRKAEEVDRAYKDNSLEGPGYDERLALTEALTKALVDFDALAQRITNESTRFRA